MMSKIRYAITAVLLSSASMNGVCDVTLPMPWRDSSATTNFLYGSDNKETAKVFLITAQISHDGDGGKRLYFNVQMFGKNISNDAVCSPEQDSSHTESYSVAYFDNQAVKIFSWCKTIPDTSMRYAEYTAATDAGSRYIINLFKTKKGNVSVKFPSVDSVISAENFSQSWNDFGGDAL